jgi:hypothetical protein
MVASLAQMIFQGTLIATPIHAQLIADTQNGQALANAHQLVDLALSSAHVQSW